MGDAVTELAEDGPVEFPVLGEDVRTAGDGLFDSPGEISSEMEALHTAMDTAGGHADGGSAQHQQPVSDGV